MILYKAVNFKDGFYSVENKYVALEIGVEKNQKPIRDVSLEYQNTGVASEECELWGKK